MMNEMFYDFVLLVIGFFSSFVIDYIFEKYFEHKDI